MIEWGHKSKPQKVPKASNKTQKNPGPKLTPKKSHAEFLSLKTSLVLLKLQNDAAGICGHYHESSDCFVWPNRYLLKSSHPKKYLPNFPT